MLYHLFIILIYYCIIIKCEVEISIENNITCGSRLPVDFAEIHYITDDNTIGLYIINNDCYKCSKILISETTQIINQCSMIWVPHGWKLYFISNLNGNIMNQKEYYFGEHGKYEIEYISIYNNIEIHTITTPINSIYPIYVLIIITFCIILCSYCIPGVIKMFGLGDILHVYTGLGSGLSANEGDTKKYDSNQVQYQSVSSISTINIIGSTGIGGDSGDGSMPLLATDNGPIGNPIPNSSNNMKNQGIEKTQKSKQRLCSLDTFRGIALSIMVFVNYGAGGYWFFDHAAWNGLTIADLMFPWFMFMMGVSMALSYASLAKKNTPISSLWYKAIRRSVLLWIIGMFIANGFHYTHWRLPGVLQYFALSNLITAGTVLICMPTSKVLLEEIQEEERVEKEKSNNWSINEADRPLLVRIFGDADGIMPSILLTCYRYEWIIQISIVILYMSVALSAKAPGCPAGYEGPGGISNQSDHPDCTGGIHRYFDMKLFGLDHIYLYPTCQRLYGCIGYDPEGALGGLSACTLTYLGLMTGRVLVHFKNHGERLKRWCIWSVLLMLLAGILCGFSQNDGIMPINKNLWSTSFCFVAAGTGILGLGVCYILIDMYNWWSGAPFRYLGMNSILIYCASDIFAEYFPFSYSTNANSHAHLLQMNVIGVSCWFVVAYWCYHKKIFLKV